MDSMEDIPSKPRGEVLLVVGDEPLRRALAETLHAEGWITLALSRLDDARLRLSRVTPVALVIDVDSLQDALALCDEVSRLATPPAVIVVSEHAQPPCDAKAPKVAFLQKPFGRHALLSRLDSAAATTASARA